MNMELALENLKIQMIADYENWQNLSGGRTEIKARMLDEYIDGVRFEEGSKYIKVIRENSVWGFIVKRNDDAKFHQGDILKAASWSGPARNFARGNVFNNLNNVRWVGA